ncbi:MAG: photosystem II protein Psb27 [Aphanocapsa feldmannii 277cV]|uniref:Photosystem II lipoprotein Psb27 n=2 Tax=Aphanocapsa feldmannii TaxID=192050 RepID=A0A524RN15_9CHRO|nr:MAG: photosystem II protein Psb27 [Aphanocapsa feldmannii 288cV]TGG92192.1 MAG: photosystem II protein Psb27 [Aphanocapsa feldmannii 277cV]TGH20704.1 MAG: photosystem II protein Psb27 [Aphanocapsa feldmannii 277cI]
MLALLGRLLAAVLALVVTLTACGGSADLSGNYVDDTLAVIERLETAIADPVDSADHSTVEQDARALINDYVSRYRRDDRTRNLSSFTTMQTELNALAAQYSSFSNRPVPEKLRDRVAKEFKQVKVIVVRGT